MFEKILFPVDLAHVERLDKALDAVARLARSFDAEVTFLGVTSTAPGPVAHDPEEFRRKLDGFAEGEASKRGIRAGAKAVTTSDPRTDVDHRIVEAAADIDADLIVMQTHMPDILDYVWHSNGERVASHAKRSVMLIR